MDGAGHCGRRRTSVAGRCHPACVRPTLTPAVRRLWRDSETLQFGRPPGRSVVLAGVDPGTRAALALLDGTRDRAELLRDAAASGCPPERTEVLLGLLQGAGVLDDAATGNAAATLAPAERDRSAADLGSLRLVGGPAGAEVLHRRRTAHVVVEGAGRVGVPVAALLSAAGIGVLDIVDDGLARPEDCGVGGLPPTAVGRRRGEAAAELLGRRPARVSRTGALPELVVLAPAGGVPLPEPPRRVAHLLAEVRGAVGVVGPLVEPGLSACLRCLDLRRADRDPGWPALALQLDTRAPGVAPCDSTLALAVATQAALQVLARIDGQPRPATLGGTLEMVLPDWRWRRRSWQLHPDCHCGTG